MRQKYVKKVEGERFKVEGFRAFKGFGKLSSANWFR